MEQELVEESTFGQIETMLHAVICALIINNSRGRHYNVPYTESTVLEVSWTLVGAYF